jgi:OmcA/MtrC family decaheme c-type cytochrome
MVFRILQNGSRTDLKVFDPAQPIATQEIWDNFMGSPSVYFVFSVPQDGIAAPADFNATVNSYLRSLWNGTASGAGKGTLTGPDASGYYTATLTGVTIPASAKMLTGGVGYSYSVTSTLPLTQTNLADYPVAAATATTGLTANMPNKIGGLIVIAPNAKKVASGYTGRRQIVDDAKCNKCHQELGAFTEDAFHGGQRNDGESCAFCHRPNQTSSGWSADSTNYIHAIHAGNKRQVPFTWDSSAVGESFADVKFPGVLKNCEGCHVRGGYDFSSAAAQSALPNRLYRTVGTGILIGTVGTTITTYSYNSGSGSCVAGTSKPQTDLGVYSLSPYIVPFTNYGIGYSFNAGLTTSNSCKPDGTLVANPAGGTVEADPQSLVNSPIATACFACHDSSLARTHMEINGASIYQPRSVALGTTETCMICHDTGRIADIKVMHAK